MAQSADERILVEGFRCEELRPGLHCIDVLGNDEQVDPAGKWRHLGKKLAERLILRRQKAVLVSTFKLEHYLLNICETSNTENSAGFDHEGMHYVVTSLDSTKLELTLPDIVETELFYYGMNVWLCFFNEPETSSAQALCQAGEAPFVDEMKNFISNLRSMTESRLSFELIAAISDGCELLWFNAKM
ncbi:uncharacterized protein LOC100897684 [Galendromus occidentalis]|uniref:Uncharacterized protein LOC100897684 n=1 Tax=Galendromus occidentalis TaxID=34638 RepID=A0AAJ6QSP2_9ACAR|nr:uncharacterized protein LOC100897684 [Galendromus occidentalis]